MTKCNQCGRPAIKVVNGHPLCVNCYSQFQNAQSKEANLINQELNFLTREMEYISGVYGLPKYDFAPPDIITANINDIKIDRSVVGVVNTGKIDGLEMAMNQINNSVGVEVANIIKQFTEEVLASQELSNEIKEQVIEQVDYISTETALPKEKQKKSMIRSAMTSINDSISSVANLIKIWEVLNNHFITLIS